ncbi:MAG: hypothetical protein KBB39_14140 [Phycicoccus sp.]|nr:hypothetical protein [Phycicoccus sp.]
MAESSGALSGKMRWTVRLRAGVQISIVADGTYIDGDDRVFELAFGSRPVALLEVARIPDEAIDDFESTVDLRES